MTERLKYFFIFIFLFATTKKLAAKSELHFSSNEKIIQSTPIILIYPDSAYTTYFISTGAEFSGEKLTVEIFDLSGRMISSNTINGGASEKISVEGFFEGIYFVRVSNGKMILSNQKIIVHH